MGTDITPIGLSYAATTTSSSHRICTARAECTAATWAVKAAAQPVGQ